MQAGAGPRVLVLGGATATGRAAIQLVKALAGACQTSKDNGDGRKGGCPWVACTASSRNADAMRALGADRVIDYRTESWWEALGTTRSSVDIIYDCVGEPGSWERARGVLPSDGSGRYITIVGDDGHGPYRRFDPHLSVFCSESRMTYAGGRVKVTSPIVARRQPRREFRAPEPPGLDPGKPPSALLPPARVHIRCVRSFLRRSPTKRRIGFSVQTFQKSKSLNLVFPNAPVHSLSLLPRSIRCAKQGPGPPPCRKRR